MSSGPLRSDGGQRAHEDLRALAGTHSKVIRAKAARTKPRFLFPIQRALRCWARTRSSASPSLYQGRPLQQLCLINLFLEAVEFPQLTNWAWTASRFLSCRLFWVLIILQNTLCSCPTTKEPLAKWTWAHEPFLLEALGGGEPAPPVVDTGLSPHPWAGVPRPPVGTWYHQESQTYIDWFSYPYHNLIIHWWSLILK